MKISDLTTYLEDVAPLSLQEEYDNAGLLLGDSSADCTGVLCTLDVNEQVVIEALHRNCNCIVAHHPLIFRGLKKITGSNSVERTVALAIKNDVAVYAAHTNLDSVIDGVNGKIADKLGLKERKVLHAKQSVLQKLYTFVPPDHLDQVRNSLFSAGAGNISDYTECSFSHPGLGTFKPGEETNPFSGSPGIRQEASEIRLEVIVPANKMKRVLEALFSAHPYEEVSYDVINLANEHAATGSGIVGTIQETSEQEFLTLLTSLFNSKGIRHTPLTGRKVRKVAVCGGAGSFLIATALRSKADVYVTADIKYHEFFGAEGRMLLCDIGHYESEQFTIDLFVDRLRQKFPTFAVLKSEINTNPVNYFPGQ